MDIPKRLKIGGHIYKVSLVGPDDLDKDCGECNVSKLEIKIKNNMPQSATEETLIHEALHAINLGLEERDVQFISMAIYQVLKDNKLIH